MDAYEDSDEEESNEVDVEFLSIDLHPPTVEQLPPSALESVNDDMNDNETGDAVEVKISFYQVKKDALLTRLISLHLSMVYS